MQDNIRIDLEKKLCYILRHRPEEFNIALDNEGFCRTKDICDCLNLNLDDLKEIVNLSNKHRFEIVNDKIRALYGHSIDDRLIKQETEPPELLYHGTTHKAYKSIKLEGLKPMKRQYVHLSKDIATAVSVGKRRDNNPIILQIRAKDAFNDGIKFYDGNELTILADDIPSKYIKINENGDKL